MEYSSVILEMLERIKVLEEKVKELSERGVASSTEGVAERTAIGKVSPKYRRLAEYLQASGESQVTLHYAEIERILGFSLPSTARNFPHSYWANTTTHSYASSWMAVGYKTQINVGSDEVTFYKELI